MKFIKESLLKIHCINPKECNDQKTTLHKENSFDGVSLYDDMNNR